MFSTEKSQLENIIEINGQKIFVKPFNRDNPFDFKRAYDEAFNVYLNNLLKEPIH